MVSARVPLRDCPGRASEPMTRTKRGPFPSEGLRSSEGHQPPTTFHLGPTRRVTSSSWVTTATFSFFHRPRWASASMPLRPSYTFATAAVSAASPPSTTTSGVGVGVAEVAGGEVVEAVGAGSLEQAPSSAAASAAASRARALMPRG